MRLLLNACRFLVYSIAVVVFFSCASMVFNFNYGVADPMHPPPVPSTPTSPVPDSVIPPSPEIQAAALVRLARFNACSIPTSFISHIGLTGVRLWGDGLAHDIASQNFARTRTFYPNLYITSIDCIYNQGMLYRPGMSTGPDFGVTKTIWKSLPPVEEYLRKDINYRINFNKNLILTTEYSHGITMLIIRVSPPSYQLQDRSYSQFHHRNQPRL